MESVFQNRLSRTRESTNSIQAVREGIVKYLVPQVPRFLSIREANLLALSVCQNLNASLCWGWLQNKFSDRSLLLKLGSQIHVQ